MTTLSNPDIYESTIYGLRNKAGLDWWDSALCRTEPHSVDFFNGRPVSVRSAKAMCARCSVIDSCLSFATVNDITDGVFGGLTRAERVAL